MKQFVIHLKQNRAMFITTLLFGCLYLLITITNHYLYRTAALDLGVFNQALDQISRFQFPTYTLSVVGHEEVNFFADHFSPGIFLLAPLYYIFGNYTCLIVQVFFLLFGGWFTYRIAQHYGLGIFASVSAGILFFSTWGNFGALSFDFHMNVVGAMLVPALFYFHITGKQKYFLVTCVAILLSKENMALWLAAILIGLIIMDVISGKRNNIKVPALMSLVSISYFFLVIAYIMPSLHPDDVNNQLNRFLDADKTITQKIWELMMNPTSTIRMLWTTDSGQVSPEKVMLHFMTLISGGIVWMWRPWLFVMMVPIYAQKFLSFDSALWGINGQYSIEFVPIISIGIIVSTREIARKWQGAFVLSFALLAAYFSHTELIRNNDNTKFFKSEFYQPSITRSEITAAIEKVDAEEISAISCLAPHVAGKGKLFHYPRMFNAENVLLLKCCRSGYPLSQEAYDESISTMRQNGQWEVVYEGKEVILFRKLTPTN